MERTLLVIFPELPDEYAARIRELRKGRLFAGLDVFETEPLPPGSPVWTCPRLLITPHAAGDTTLPYNPAADRGTVPGGFENYCGGRPLSRLVDRRAGY